MSTTPDFRNILAPAAPQRDTYKFEVIITFIASFIAHFFNGWFLMLALGNLGVNLGYWPAFATAWLLNSVIGWPSQAITTKFLKLKHNRL